MESDFSLWWLIIFLPALVIGVAFGFFPHKVVQFRAKLQENMFRSFNMNDEAIDRSIYSTIFGESYSKRLKAQQEQPRDFRSLIILSRIIGFFTLLLVFIVVWLIISAARTGNIIIR